MNPILFTACLHLFLLSRRGFVEAYDIPNFNFSISSRHNETGGWYALVHLGHEENYQWDVEVNHVVTVWNGTKSIVIDTKIIAPLLHQNESAYTTKRREPPAGYELVGSSYKKLHTVYKTWSDALEICRNEGTHLLIINSKEEAEAVKNLVKKVGTTRKWFWIGVHDQYEEGNYITIFNNSLSSTGYDTWCKDQPDEINLQNCVWFYNDDDGYCLRDGSCTDGDNFICEIEL